tara:strand:- start:671 stop:898 length:228 start_codon:yes stop_codon:yes gene_type:complete
MIKTIEQLRKKVKEVHGETIMIGFQEKKIDNLSNSKVISIAWFGDIINDNEEVELAKLGYATNTKDITYGRSITS